MKSNFFVLVICLTIVGVSEMSFADVFDGASSVKNTYATVPISTPWSFGNRNFNNFNYNNYRNTYCPYNYAPPPILNTTDSTTTTTTEADGTKKIVTTTPFWQNYNNYPYRRYNPYYGRRYYY